MIPTFADRLRCLMDRGNLTVSDLARWFGRPHPTVNGWVKGVALGGAPLDAALILAEVTRLERRIKRGDGFPVPRLSPTNRIAYLKRLRA